MKNKLVIATAALLLTQFNTFPAEAAEATITTVPTTATPGTKNTTFTDLYTSVPERFRTYAAPRTPAALAALFSVPVASNIRQQPVVVLSDGNTTVKINIFIGSPDTKAPNVASKGAQLISIKRDKADTLEIEALPTYGTANASLILMAGSVTNEVPITVAPMLPTETDLSEKAFIAFLGGANASGQPLRDLNNDGLLNYLDEYIFTANYLVRTRFAATVPATASQNSVSQNLGDQVPPDVQAPGSRQSSELQQPAGDQSLDITGSTFTGQVSNTQPPRGGTESAPVQTQGTGTKTDNVPVVNKEITLDTSPDRHNPATRNERARKIKELMYPPVK